jgi:predicted ABC-type ATPase
MVAGPNGAGKTTLTTFLRQQRVDFGTYINPDDIAAGLSGSYVDRVRSAQRRADEMREACILASQSFSFETVMSHPSKIEVLDRAKRAGFHTTLYFVGTEDPEISVDRVKARVQLGGHDVPEGKIRSRWLRTMENLRPAMLVADVSFVFDNSSFDGGPRLILRTESRPQPTGRRASIGRIPGWVLRYAMWPPNC